jgi:prepilin-type N-terminal cleavage/methylation domain-containing protein
LQNHRSSRHGFTLVELSIVLVVIGLLIGGVLIGQSLISSARVNSQIQQIEQFDIAATNFKLRFRQTPGDSNLISIVRQGSATTDKGNNNGTLYSQSVTTGTCSIHYSAEHMIYFAQLSTAGMLSHKFLNGYGLAINNAGVSFPKSPLTGGNIFVWDNNYVNGSSEIYYYVSGPKEMPSGHLGDLTGHILSSSGMQYMTPVEAVSIDKKMDDGIANSGIVFAASWWNNGTNDQCTSPNYYPYPMDIGASTPGGANAWGGCNLTASLGTYNIENKDKRCRLGIKARF